jgi:ribonuclease P/MRP protein subunit RPP1
MYDLCIPIELINSAGLEKVVKELTDLGYTSIAVESDKYSTKTLTQSPMDKHFNIYSRLSLTLDNEKTNYNNQIKQHSQKYNLISATPTTEKLFQLCCQELEIDIISLDFTQVLNFHLKPTFISSALKRKIKFEILYAPSIRDINARKNCFQGASDLIRKTGGKNVILSSQATDLFELRGVNDVVNLCQIFGMDPESARKSMGSNCENVIFRGATRQYTYRGVVSVEEAHENYNVSVKDVQHQVSVVDELQKAQSIVQGKKRVDAVHDDGERKSKNAKKDASKDVHSK